MRRDGLYNRAIANVIDGVREFLVLHYKAAGRTGLPYWRDAETRQMPDALAERIELWKHQLPDSETIFPYYHGLPPYSYMCILLGMGGIELKASPALRRRRDLGPHAVRDIRDRARPSWRRCRPRTSTSVPCAADRRIRADLIEELRPAIRN